MKSYGKGKKGGMSPQTFFIFLFAVIGLGFVAMWLFNLGGDNASSPLAIENIGNANSNAVTQKISLVEDTTVTFSSWDEYALGTNAGVAHRVLMYNGDKNIVVADDGTRTYSPDDKYSVLIGNKTTSLVANTDYYPVYKTGVTPDKGTYTVGEGQPKVAGASQVTFTYFNENDQVNTAQSLSTNDKRTVKWRLRAADNLCVGNSHTNGQNAMTYTYNNTVYTKVQQLDDSNKDQTALGTPTSIAAVAGKRSIAYSFPVVCDNQQIERAVRLETGATESVGTVDNINMTVSDVSIDYDADTLDLIGGIGANGVPNGAFEDEDNNDIGIADFVVGNLVVS